MHLQELLQLLLHLLRGLIRGQRDPTRPLAERGKALMHPRKKRQPLRLDPVLALTSPPQRCLLGLQLQPTAQIRLHPCGGHLFELINQREIQAAAIPLIRSGGPTEAITQHPMPRGQGGLNAALNMLSAIGGIEQSLRTLARGRLLGRMQQQLPQRLPQRGATGFTGENQLSPRGHQAALGQPGSQLVQLGGFAAAIDAFQHQKPTPHAGNRSNRALHTTVIELNAISSAANGGVSNRPKPGSNTPAARGSTTRL